MLLAGSNFVLWSRATSHALSLPSAPAHGQSAEQSVLCVWRGLVRLSVEAHQRRGESDGVARWTHLLLSLDADAPEWGTIMPGLGP